MKFLQKLLLILYILLLLNSCKSLSKSNSLNSFPKDKRQPFNVNTIVNSNNNFAFKLYKSLIINPNNVNVFFSPISIYTALCMAYNGAEGNTKLQMQKVLYISVKQQDLPIYFNRLLNQLKTSIHNKCELYIANAMWIQRDFYILPSFKRILFQYYDSQIFNVDFIKNKDNVVKRINYWISKKTRNKIKKLITKSDIDYLTRLILTNAVYFKGSWASKFDKLQTKIQKFYINSIHYVNIKMMHQINNFKYLKTNKFQIIELPYSTNKIAMIIILPNQINKIDEIINNLTLNNLYKYLHELHTTKINLYIPKFKLKNTYHLKTILYKLGMTDAFTNKANFSAITGKKNLKIRKIIHQAYIDVNEKGTEAAGATAVIYKLKCVFMPITLKVNHPFIFFIIHKPTNTILFMGRVINPKAKSL